MRNLAPSKAKRAPGPEFLNLNLRGKSVKCRSGRSDATVRISFRTPSKFKASTPRSTVDKIRDVHEFFIFHYSTLAPRVGHPLNQLSSTFPNTVSIPLLVCFDDAKISVFKNDAGGNPINVFENHSHNGYCVDIVRLFDDVLFSLDNKGYLYAWHASSGIILGSCRLDGNPNPAICKLNDAELAITTGRSTISILKHAKGCNIEQGRRILSDIHTISDMDAYGKTVAAVGWGGKCEIWNSATGVRTASFKIAQRSDLVRMSDDYIICCQSNDGIIDMYANDNVCGLPKSIDLNQYFVQQGNMKHPHINDVTLISSNLFMVVCWRGIVFVSLPTGKIIACFKFGDLQSTSCGTILHDGRIFAGGTCGNFATFQAPDIIRGDVKRFAHKIYGEPGATTAVSNDEDVEPVSGLHKRGRQEYEGGNGTAEITEMKLALKKLGQEMETKLEAQKAEIIKIKSEREVEKAVVKRMMQEANEQKEKAKNMEEKVKNMEKEMKLELQFSKSAFIKQ